MTVGAPGDTGEVVAELRKYERQFDELLTLLVGKRQLSPSERADAQERYRALKDALRVAAKTGTVGGMKRPRTAIEDAFLEPAVRKASANLTAAPKVNTNPIASNWYGALYGVRIDITHCLYQLDKTPPAGGPT